MLTEFFNRIRGKKRRKEQCLLLPAVLADEGLGGRPVAQELDRLFTLVAGRRLASVVMGDHAERQSLTDFFERGAKQAETLRPFLHPGDAVLDYGGGLGRIARAVAPNVGKIVSVDREPMMAIYGPRLAPGVEFRSLGQLPEAPVFDGAYAVAVFAHLPLDQQALALDYVHRRLKPGGWFLVDLKIGSTTARQTGEYGPPSATSFDDFCTLYEPLFGARRVPLFNAGFLLQKKDTRAMHPAPAVDGRYTVNEASVVADVLEGEVVIVNLDSGAYYILQGTASLIWQMLAAGRRVDDIGATLARLHDGNEPAIVGSVTAFVEQLTAESLVVPATGEPAVPFDDSQLTLANAPFSDPVMFRYTDMQALIQMDPIREYDETGWPRRPAPPATPGRG